MSAPTDDDRIEVLRRFLSGLTRGADAEQLAIDIGDLHVRNDTFPGEVFMELSADALARGRHRSAAPHRRTSAAVNTSE